MAEYIKNTQSSDDGELWKLLPSDIFPVDQEVSEPKHCNSSHDHQLSCMAETDLLAQRLAAFSFIEPTPPTSSNQSLFKPLPNLERFWHEVPCISIGSSLPPPVSVPVPAGWWLVCNSSGGTHRVLGYGTGSFWPNVVPVYPYPFLIPIHTWVEGFGGERVGALQSQQNRQVLNRLLPLPGGGVGNGGGFARDYGGTGVFLPRKPASISSTIANNNSTLARKRQGVRNRHRAQFLPKKDFTNPVDMKKQEDYSSLLPSEIDLPTEWTY